MISTYEDWMDSEFITVDEKGWHISDDAPDELKKKFKEFIGETDIKIELED